ncbi:sugar phosphate nucleotidyltransferase [Halosegnis longus]|uniref:Bifunctional protein GlmU n=1 Tax=Halosegnis longus TaxID=2216012 RepID=A0AAJ4R9Q3_9EURY|nr:nucleotidyl transferase [Salella cibi]
MTVSTGVVLAAGEGTRLRPLTRTRPKPMVPVCNRPILEYVLDALIDAGISELVLVVGYKHDRVQNHIGSTYRDRPVTYVHQRKQLGSGHALLQARNAVDGPFVSVNGDRVIDPQMVADVLDGFDGETPTMAVREHANAAEYPNGAVRLDGERVTELVEQPDGPYRLINAGVYAFPAGWFDRLAETERRDGDLYLPDAIVELAAERAVVGVRTEGLWVDITYPWDLLTATRRLLGAGRVDEQSHEPGLYVHETARVHENATLQRPVVVGPDAEIAGGVVVGPDTALGRNVTVEANATIEGSLVGGDTRLGPGATVRDCVTGMACAFGPGVVVPGGETDVRVGIDIHEDERLGAIAGDRVTLGGGAVCEPGTVLGVGATVGVGAVARDHIEEDAEVVR